MAFGTDDNVMNRAHEVHPPGSPGWVNIDDRERMASLIGGGLLALFGLSRRSLAGYGFAALGSALLYRGMTGHCHVREALGHGSRPSRGARSAVPANRGVRVEKTLTISRRPDELYLFWRDFSNLPRIMKHIESVEVTDPTRSHWAVRGPAGALFEWDSIIINEKENELIAWRSLEGADVDHAGSVHFKPAPGGRGTEMKVVLRYDPPGGRAGAALAKALGQDPDRQIEEELRHFKQIMEAGEVPRTQPLEEAGPYPH